MSSSTTEVQASSDAKTRAQKKIAVLGCGKMGTILLESFLERKLITPEEAIATVQHGERSQDLSRELGGVPVGTDNRAAVAGAEIVLLCVKPQVLGQLLEEIAPALAPDNAGNLHCRFHDDKFHPAKTGKEYSGRPGHAQHARHGGRRHDRRLRRPGGNGPASGDRKAPL